MGEDKRGEGEGEGVGEVVGIINLCNGQAGRKEDGLDLLSCQKYQHCKFINIGNNSIM